MSTRLQRLATDWKTLAGGLVTGVGAGLAAATELVNKLALAIAGVKNLPPEAKWLAAGLLAALSVLALWAARSRRSILLRPERFVISADDPEHLVGRDEEVKALAKASEQNTLVFLQGESGAGKSALVLGGLLPHYQATGAGNDAPRLLPIRIDASPLAWDNGLRIELARALREVSAEEQARLGVSAGPGSGDPFSWLTALPVDATCQVLLVLDQIDDYAVAHQARFVRDHTVVAAERFEEANADWAAIGSLVRKGSIHLLIICCADAAGILDALRFTRATTLLLPRIDRQLISPILDRVTQADEGATVVADPEDGWLQLKAQLLRDFAAGGTQILPVQLAIGLDSVRRFRSLTPAEYAKNGGVRGLERLHIEPHLHDAARAAGLGDDALLRGLMCLVTEDGLKTKRATWQEFGQAIGVTGPGAAALETAVEHLADPPPPVGRGGRIPLAASRLSRPRRPRGAAPGELLGRAAPRTGPGLQRGLRLAPALAGAPPTGRAGAPLLGQAARPFPVRSAPAPRPLEHAAVLACRRGRCWGNRGQLVGLSGEPAAVGGAGPRRDQLRPDGISG